MSSSSNIVLDEFAFRQFDDTEYGGTKIPVSKECFMQKVESYYAERKEIESEYPDRPVLVDGYAPFCKHIFMSNFDNRIVDPTVRITQDNESLLRTKYEARSEEELPVLTRFFPSGSVKPSTAKFLDLILYSRDQIEKERRAMGRNTDKPLEDVPWRLISIKAQSVPYEIPMNPITMMRNELISEGGSGTPIDRKAYMKSVEYWKDHAIIR